MLITPVYRRPTLLYLIVLLAATAFPARAQTLHWQRLNGPYGGAVIDLIADSSGNVFALTADEIDKLDSATGMDRLTAGAGSWKQLLSGLHFNSIPSAAILRNKTDIAIRDGSAWLETYDGGKTWTRTGGEIVEDILSPGFNLRDTVYAGSAHHGVVRTYSSKYLSYWEQVDTSHWPVYALLHASGDRIFAGSDGTVYSSTDRGKTWAALPVQPGIQITALVEFQGSIVIGTSGSGVFEWSTASSRWIPLNPGVGPWLISSFAIRDGGLYVSSLDDGVYRYDGGTSWTPFNTQLPETRVTKILARENGDFFAGTSNGVYAWTGANSWAPIGLPITLVANLVETPRHSILARCNNGLFRSTDSGAHWTNISINASRNSVGGIVELPNRTLLAADGNEVFRSKDNGEHWSMTIAGPVGGSPGSLYYIGGSSLYLYNDYLYRSSNNGASWTLQNNLAQIQPRAFSGKDDWLFGADGRAVYRSRDSGAHWDSVFKNGTVLSQGRSVRVMNVYESGKYASYYSSNGGDAWQLLPGSDQYQIHASAVSTSGVYFAANGGVLRASDLSSPYSQTALTNYTTAIASNGPSVVAFDARHGVFYSIDDGTTWHASHGAYDSVLSLMSDAGGRYFASTTGGIYRSDDSGRTFAPTSRGLERTTIDFGLPPSPLALAVSPNGHVFANAPGRGLEVSTDEGDHWTSVDTANFTYSGIPFYVAPTGRIFRNLSTGTYDLTYSDDEGSTWTSVDQTLLQNLVFDSLGGVIAFNGPTGSNTYVHYSSDGGVHWQQFEDLHSYGNPCFAAVDPKGQIYLCNLFFGTSDGQHALITASRSFDTVQHPALDTESITAIAVDRSGTAYVGASDLRRSYSYRLYRSTDRAKTWSTIKDSTFPVESIDCILPTEHYLYVGMDGSGIMRAAIAGVTRAVPKLAEQGVHLRIYPDPANGEATISCDDAAPSSIDIYNALGLCVVTNKEVSQDPQIDTRHLASGVYSVVVTSPNGTHSCKLVVQH